MQASNDVSAQTDAQDLAAKELTIVSTISKTGNRYVVGVPSKYKDYSARYLGSHVVVTLKPIL